MTTILTQGLIEHHRKDINLFTAHLLALLQQNQEGSGFLCIALVEAILTHWFDTAYPETTKAKGVKVWNNRLNQIGVRLQKNAEQLLLNERHIPYQEMVGDLLKTISENASLEVADLKSALRYLRDNLAAIQVTAVSLPTQIPQVNARSQAVANPPASSLSSKELKQCYQSIIEHHSSIDLYDPMVYRLRRHMLWSTIQSAPDKDDTGRTELFAPPGDLRDFYQQQLQESPTEAVWQRLESSLENSPYWISGNYMSVQFALALGYEAIALSIKEEVACFFQRLPVIESLLFADKTSSIPFMDEATQQWILSPEASTEPLEAPEAPIAATETQVQWVLDLPLPTDLMEATKQFIRENNIASVLTLFDEYLSQTLEPRSRCYASLVLAEVYEKLSMKSMAASQYQQVWAMLNPEAVHLERWEPQLLAHVRCRLLVLGLIDSTLLLDHQSLSVGALTHE